MTINALYVNTFLHSKLGNGRMSIPTGVTHVFAILNEVYTYAILQQL